MLQEAIAKAEGEDRATKEKRELEELKQLLPEIREKVEDAMESQRTAGAASQAIQQTLVSTRIRRNSVHITSGSGFKLLYLSLQGGASTSSAFPCENGGPSSSSSSSAPVSQVAQSRCAFQTACFFDTSTCLNELYFRFQSNHLTAPPLKWSLTSLTLSGKRLV